MPNVRFELARAKQALQQLPENPGRASRYWRLTQYLCSTSLYLLVGSAVLLGNPVSVTVAKMTGLSGLVEAGVIDKQSNPGWRAICLFAIAFHLVGQFASGKAEEARAAEGRRTAAIAKRNQLLAAIQGLEYSLDRGQSSQEVLIDLEVLVNANPNFFAKIEDRQLAAPA